MAQATETHVDFEEERAAFQTTADEFVRRAIVPALDQARSEISCPRVVLEDAAEAGLLGVLAPEAAGGGGLSDPRFGELVVQAATRAGATGIGLALGLHSNVAVPIVVSAYIGHDKNDLLAGMADGSTLVAIAGHTGGISAQASGAGLELTGTAHSVVNAANADKYLVVLDIDDLGCRAVLVDAQAAKVLPPVKNLGARDAGSRDVVLDGVRVDPDAILVGGRQAVDQLLVDYALVLSAVSIAGARAAVNNTVAYVQERKVFGRALGEFENTQFVLAGLWAELLVAASYHDDCAKRRGLAELRFAEAGTALVRSFAVYDKAVDQGMQLHGGYGYMLEYPIAHAFADARFVGLVTEAMPVLRSAILADLGL
jgi:alkylation response protein AidB-like acyl-CoA dehydrogenase